MVGQTAGDARARAGLISRRRIVVIDILGWIDRGNDVFFFSPCAQIDLLATLGAERAKLVLFQPFDFFAASRAIYNCCHNEIID